MANIGRRPHRGGPGVLEAATTAAMRTLCSLEGSVIASFDLILWDNSVRFPRAPNLAVSRQLLPVKLRPEHQMFVHELIFRLNNVILFCYASLFLSAIIISDAFIKSISGTTSAG